MLDARTPDPAWIAPVTINDPMGKDATLFHQAANGDPESAGGQYISEAARWFNSVWAIAPRR